MWLAWHNVPSHSSRPRLERRNLVHQMRADNQTSDSECSVFERSLGCSPISLLIGFPTAAMKIMMFPAEQWTAQTHVHCRRYIHLAQLAGCDVTFVEYRGIVPAEIPTVDYRRHPRRYR